jgi:C1A family cysteine protease
MMRRFIQCVGILFLTIASTGRPQASPITVYSYPSFEEFQKLYDKTYERDLVNQRAQIYNQNIQFISQHNSNPLNGYRLDINEWADLSWDEFQQMRLGIQSAPSIQHRDIFQDPFFLDKTLEFVDATESFNQSLSKSIPENWDWTWTLPAIKDQGNCGSCWAFSTVCSIEHKMFFRYNGIRSLSEQQFVDCERKSFGCRGGFLSSAFSFAVRNRLALNSSYPYVGVQKRCNNSLKIVRVPRIRGYGVSRKPLSDSLLKSLTYQRVLSVGIEANQAFRFYSSGIFNGPCNKNINHAVNIIGFTKDYWIVRNSWGKDWGESGHMRIARVNPPICGLGVMAYYPIT